MLRRLPAVLLLACVAGTTVQPLQGQHNPPADAVIPRPASLTSKTGRFALTSSTAIWTTRETAVLGRLLANYLAPATGFDLNVRSAGTPTGSRIVLRLDPKLTRLGDEGYTLDVAPGVVSIRASKAAGIFYGIQSLRQLLPVEIFR